MISSRGHVLTFQGSQLARERGTATLWQPVYSLLESTSRILFQQLTLKKKFCLHRLYMSSGASFGQNSFISLSSHSLEERPDVLTKEYRWAGRQKFSFLSSSQCHTHEMMAERYSRETPEAPDWHS